MQPAHKISSAAHDTEIMMTCVNPSSVCKKNFSSSMPESIYDKAVRNSRLSKNAHPGPPIEIFVWSVQDPARHLWFQVLINVKL
jgi:hypothetical protein